METLTQAPEQATGKKREAGRLTQEHISAKYPHVIPGSLRYDEVSRKQQVEIHCVEEGCEETRIVFTSDLFQVSRCHDHVKAARKARAKERRAAKKEQAQS